MGLAPTSLAQWLPRLASAAEFQRKLGLLQLSQLPEPVYQSLDGSEAAQQRAASYVLRHLEMQFEVQLESHQQRQAEPAVSALRRRPDLPPLVEAAAQVPDDLCVLQLNPQTEQFCLVAASLCSPSYWALSDKLGLPLSAIHNPVPGLNAQLGARMHHFFQQMPQRQCFVRRNFFVHVQQELYQPQSDTTDYRQVSCNQLMLRSERQSLLRLSENLVLFSIRVDLAPLADAPLWPTQAGALHRVLSSLSSSQRKAFGSSTKLEGVLGMLAGLRPEGG